MDEPIVRFRDVDIVFGDRPKAALPLIDAGRTRDEIREATGQVVAVANATLDVAEGEIVVLMGLSGSGKSSLLRAVNGLNPITRGETLVHDGTGYVDPSRCGKRVLRRLRSNRVAMVFQQFALLPWRTVAENVGYGLELAGVARSERRDRVAEQLDLVGLHDWGERQVHELSGGMQQRVGLARAFATAAPVLLMDEPYSALDPLIRANLQDELLGLQRQLSRTIVFVSHDLDEAVKIGSRIAIMEGGRIVQAGTPQDIVLRPATDYVAQFVAHMNPLSVLRAAEVMTPLSSLDASDGERKLDEAGNVLLGSNGPRARDGDAIDTVQVGSDAPRPGTVAVATPETSVKSLIEARLATGLPVLISDQSEYVGVVGDRELYGGLLAR